MNACRDKDRLNNFVLREQEINPWKNSRIQLGFEPKPKDRLVELSPSLSCIFEGQQEGDRPIVKTCFHGMEMRREETRREETGW